MPLSWQSKLTIAAARQATADVLAGLSDKIVVIVGPCSIHNPEEAKEYAGASRGGQERDRWSDGQLMRDCSSCSAAEGGGQVASEPGRHHAGVL